VLPILHACDSGDAQLVYENMRVGSGSNTDFEVVKAAFERRYDCMGVTCAHVGGLLQADGETYFEGAEPCGNGQTVATQAEATGASGAAAYGVSVAIGLAAGFFALLA
jgi:hypothetical protein